MDVVATAPNDDRAPAPSRKGLLLLLSLSSSPASKVIAKGGKHDHRRADDGGAFRCRTCGRRFPTFQALGGHRTSHNRPRVRANGLDLLLGARPGRNQGTARAVVVHRCHSCGVVFPTGQALGGHMRRHRTAAAEFGFVAARKETVSAELSEGEGGGDESDAAHLTASNLIRFL